MCASQATTNANSIDERFTSSFSGVTTPPSEQGSDDTAQAIHGGWHPRSRSMIDSPSTETLRRNLAHVFRNSQVLLDHGFLAHRIPHLEHGRSIQWSAQSACKRINGTLLDVLAILKLPHTIVHGSFGEANEFVPIEGTIGLRALARLVCFDADEVDRSLFFRPDNFVDGGVR